MQFDKTSTGLVLTIGELMNERARENPHGIAFVQGARKLTHAQFRDLVLCSTSWLLSRNVRRGDRVAVWMVNSVEWLALYFALAQLGAALVAVNTRYRSEEVGYLLSRSRANRLIMQLSFRDIDFREILLKIKPENLNFLEEIGVFAEGSLQSNRLLELPAILFDPQAFNAYSEPSEADPEDLSVLFTTSGTTSGPKLVMHCQRTIADHARQSATYHGFTAAGARMLAAVPFCGTYGLNSVLAAYAGGAPVYIMDMFNADGAVGLLRDHAITHTFGSDDMFRRILECSSSANPFPNARVFGFAAFNSGAVDFANSASQRGIPLAGLYGSSEVLALFSMQPMELPVALRVECGGKPVMQNARVRIREIATGFLVVDGSPGEIEIHSPSAFIGYFDDPQATTQALTHDGYFRTGDLGYLRGDGTFVFQTRMGDAIRIGGFLVNPVEIEDVLKRVNGVIDAQVVAVDIAGHAKPVAFVILGSDFQPSKKDLIEATKASLASFKIPAHIWFVSEYPVTQSANGVKTQRGKLREWAQTFLEDETSDLPK